MYNDGMVVDSTDFIKPITLITDERNPRKIIQARLILVSDDCIIAGHAMLVAARELGLRSVRARDIHTGEEFDWEIN